MKPIKLLLTLVCACAALVSSCTTAPPGSDGGSPLNNYTVVYTGDAVEVTGLTGDVSGVGWNLQKNYAFIVYSDGTRKAFRVTGGGINAGKRQIVLALEGGHNVTVDLRTGKVTSTKSGFEPPTPVTVSK